MIIQVQILKFRIPYVARRYSSSNSRRFFVVVQYYGESTRIVSSHIGVSHLVERTGIPMSVLLARHDLLFKWQTAIRVGFRELLSENTPRSLYRVPMAPGQPVDSPG